MSAFRRHGKKPAAPLFVLSVPSLKTVVKTLESTTMIPSSSRSLTFIFDLGDDEMIEILLKLPVDVVHRFKCVSKRWYALISDALFISRYIQLRADKPQQDDLIIFQLLNKSGHMGLLGHLDSLPKSEQNLSTSNVFDSSFEFLPLLKYRAPQSFDVKFKILGVSHGLVLCEVEVLQRHSIQYSRQHAMRNKTTKPPYLYVCNPLTKQWVELPSWQTTPPAPFGINRDFNRKGTAPFGFTCYYLDENLPYKIQFIVARLDRSSNGHDDFFVARVFSSEHGSWRKIDVACPPGQRGLDGTSGLVVCNGVFYWYGGRGIVQYDPINEPHKCKFIDFPPGSGRRPCVHQSAGRIRVMSALDKNDFRVWELVDHNEGTWCLKHDTKIPIEYSWIAFFSETDENIACFKDASGQKLLLFNMKNNTRLRVLELPTQEGNLGSAQQILPFVMTSWPTIIPQLPKVPPRFEHSKLFADLDR